MIAPDARSHAGSAGSFSLSDAGGKSRLLVATTSQPAPLDATPAVAAEAHLARHASALGASPQMLASVEVVSTSNLGAGGVLARFRQRVDGIEVYRGQVRMLLRHNLELAAISGQLQPVAAPRPETHPFRVAPEDALARALHHLYGTTIAPALLSEVSAVPASLDDDADNEGRYAIAEGAPIFFPQPARVKKIFFPVGAALVPAYFIELFAGAPNAVQTDAFRYLVAADDGRVLERRDLTSYDSFNYRVWADTGGDKRPTDGPQQDWTPHPTGKPGLGEPAFIGSSLIAMEGFNKNPMGVADPWLPKGATVTQGNNVDAYVDWNMPDGFSQGDFRASTTSANTFDRSYDLLLGPTSSNAQAQAGITQLFYDNNWLHDWWYDAGFDEAAGNAQKDNFGRGGKGGDPLLAESQDDVFGGSKNNSNMQTPSDGMSPRMQAFVWSGQDVRKLTVTPPGGDLPTGPAGFGPQAADVTAAVVLVNDGQNVVTDGCEAITNNVTGKVALIDRGGCTFKQKVANAQNAGAVGVLIADNQNAQTPPTLADGQPNVKITIPAFGITRADGNALKAALGNGIVTARLAHQAGVDRDGSLDNTVIAHEWGHYLHHRLADCGSHQCSAVSEGWGDFSALYMLLRDGDDLDGAYPMAIYATVAMADPYFGLRRQPYSVDLNRDGLSFRHIGDGAQLPNTLRSPVGGPNSEVHNAGEIWASMMFDAYVALQKDAKAKMLPFDDARRRMASYIVTGLQLTPSDATFTESRDALLAAAAARSPSDLQILAAAFARRGAGTCAVSPARDSMNLTGVVESTEVKPRISLGTPTLDDAVRSCDNDGVLDAGERGHITISVMNGGPAVLSGTHLAFTMVTNGVSFPNGALADVADIAPYSSAKVTLDVKLAEDFSRMAGLDLTVKADNASSCESSISQNVVWRMNYDEVPMASATDDVESEHPVWMSGAEMMGVPGDKVWSRGETGPLQHAWRGIDYGAVSDTWLMSPDLQVSAMQPLTIGFSHRHSFEAGDDNGTFRDFDGGVLELSPDGGQTWHDISDYAKPGYTGTITDVSGNPLAKRNGFVAKNAAWPAQEKVSLDLGMQLAGKTIRIRFRIGTDQAASEFGWEIDDIAFGGIDNKPFAVLVDDPNHCNPVVMTDAAMASDMGAAPTTDAAVLPDAGDAGSAMPPLASNGCNCSVVQRNNFDPRLLFGLFAAAILGTVRLRRRRS